MRRVDRRRLLDFAGMRTIAHATVFRGAAGGKQVGVGDVVDLGDGNVAVGIADESMPHGLRIEFRPKGAGE